MIGQESQTKMEIVWSAQHLASKVLLFANRWWCQTLHMHCTILCTKLVRLITHEWAIHFTQWIYEFYLPWQGLSIYQDRFMKGVPETVPHMVYFSRLLLCATQLISQWKHIVHLSQLVVLVLGIYWIILFALKDMLLSCIDMQFRDSWHNIFLPLPSSTHISTIYNYGKGQGSLSRPPLGDHTDALCIVPLQ